MKHTQSELQKLADEGKLSELDEIAARYVGLDDAVENNDKDMLRYFKKYSPTTNGGQAFDLLDKLKMSPRPRYGDWLIFVSKDNRVEHKSLPIAITIAAILVLQD